MYTISIEATSIYSVDRVFVICTYITYCIMKLTVLNNILHFGESVKNLVEKSLVIKGLSSFREPSVISQL